MSQSDKVSPLSKRPFDDAQDSDTSQGDAIQLTEVGSRSQPSEGPSALKYVRRSLDHVPLTVRTIVEPVFHMLDIA